MFSCLRSLPVCFTQDMFTLRLPTKSENWGQLFNNTVQFLGAPMKEANDINSLATTAAEAQLTVVKPEANSSIYILLKISASLP